MKTLDLEKMWAILSLPATSPRSFKAFLEKMEKMVEKMKKRSSPPQLTRTKRQFGKGEDGEDLSRVRTRERAIPD